MHLHIYQSLLIRMSLPPNLESLLASPAKAILPLVADDSVNNVVSTVVVSPLLNADRDETIIVKEPPSVFLPKIVSSNNITSDDPAKHSSSGHDVMLVCLNILSTKGYDACMGHGKKTPFIEEVNAQLHADDGPLVRY